MRSKTMSLNQLGWPLLLGAVMLVGSDSAWAWRRRVEPSAPVFDASAKLEELAASHDFHAPLVPLISSVCNVGAAWSSYPNYYSYHVGPYFVGDDFGTAPESRRRCEGYHSIWSAPAVQQPGVIAFDLEAVSASGSAFNGLITMESPVFTEIMTTRSPSLRVRYQVELKNCDGQDVMTKPNPRTLEDLVVQFQGIDFKSFFRCNLELRVVASDSVPLTRYRDLWLNFGTAVALSRGQLVMTFKGNSSFHYSQNQIVFQPSTRPRDERRKEEALQAARDFVALIKSHGAEIIKASDPSLNANERQMILKASLEAKKPLIVGALKRLNQNYSELELVEKFSASASVRQAYDYVREIETRVGQLRNYNQMLNLGNLFNIE